MGAGRLGRVSAHQDRELGEETEEQPRAEALRAAELELERRVAWVLLSPAIHASLMVFKAGDTADLIRRL